MPIYNPTSSSVTAANILGTLSVAQGGTGQSNATTARTALGLGSLATQNSVALSTDVTGTLALLNGGTFASNLADVFTNFTMAATTYTPALTNVANLDGSTASEFQYIRIGNVVGVSGAVHVNPTLTATSTQLGIALPIASNLGAAEDCAGTAFTPAIAGMGAAIIGDTANDRAQMQWVATDVTGQSMYIHFIYNLI